MKTLLLSLTLLFLFASVSLTTFAQPKQKFNKGVSKERTLDKLNLTKEQQEKISDLRNNHQKKMVDLRAELQKAKIDMGDLQDDSDFSRSAMISAVERINDIKNKIALERANHRMDIYEFLTDEQKEIWQKHKPLRDHKRMCFRHGGSGPNKQNRMKQPIFDID